MPQLSNKKRNSPETTKISVIIPTRDEEATIGKIVNEIDRILGKSERPFEILVIDDGSNDNTARNAKEAGAKVIKHPYNIGNGAAIKTGIRHAMGSILVMIDGDGQHDAEDIPKLLEHIENYDMVVGARSKSSETYFHRRTANKIYNLFASYVCNFKVEDLTSGFRTIKSDIARKFIDLLPNTFSYPSTLTLAVIRSGFSIKYLPIKTHKRKGKSKIKLTQDGIRFLNIILRIAVFFAPLRVFVPISALFFLLGFGWYIYSVFFTIRRFPPVSIVLMITSVIVFFLGVISDQIAHLKHYQND